MGDTCLPGLQGFPVQITGWSGYAEKSNLVIPNDIHLQFGPSKIPLTLNKSTGELINYGQSTFFMNGTQYNVRVVRVSAAKQEGIGNFSGAPVAEFQIWGIPAGNPNGNLAVFIIPIIQKPAENPAGSKLISAIAGNPVQLVDCIPSGPGTDIVKYTTCIETDKSSTVTVSAAYWSNGVAITQQMARSLPQPLPPAGIPNAFGFRVLSSFVQFADEKQTKGQRKYTDVQNILQPYASTVLLSVGSAEFKNGFRLIQNFEIKKTTAEQDLSAYKCIAIDRSRDIKNGKLLVDPSSGRRLDDEVATAEKQEKDALEKPDVSKARSIWITVCIILGTILGIAVLAGILWGISTFFLNKQSLEIPEVGSPDVYNRS
jgi:hypothetical protein